MNRTVRIRLVMRNTARTLITLSIVLAALGCVSAMTDVHQEMLLPVTAVALVSMVLGFMVMVVNQVLSNRYKR